MKKLQKIIRPIRPIRHDLQKTFTYVINTNIENPAALFRPWISMDYNRETLLQPHFIPEVFSNIVFYNMCLKVCSSYINIHSNVKISIYEIFNFKIRSR